jgi:2,4-dienoyl-CoA reductase-like NADH-dependent reductase (Old Yellow Enzyme family)
MTNPMFKPFTCKGLSLPNRVVMAPMTRSQSPGGVPTAAVADYYARRAAADVGLIITEGTVINRGGASNDPNIPEFHGDKALAGWKRVAEHVHQAGGKIAPQIWHMGLVRKPGTGLHPDARSDSPSGVTHKGKHVADTPSDSEIADMVMAYAEAAGNAAKLGFDTVEIHGAHGYLIDQFFWGAMNIREDKYGGDYVGRANFAAEIIRECKKQMPDDMPLILRFSQWKQQDYAARLADTPQKLEAFLKVFVDAGIDILHCSQRRFWEAEFEGSDLNLAGWSKKLTGLPTISVGSVGLAGDFIGSFGGEGSKTAPLEMLYERMERGEFDLIAVGRAILQDPDWAAKVKDGRMDELEAFTAASLASLS